MRARVSQATMKRLARIEMMRSNVRPRGDFPPILPIDEWEALAEASQEQLCSDTRGYLDATYPDEAYTGPDPADVSQRYQPGAGPYRASAVARAARRGPFR